MSDYDCTKRGHHWHEADGAIFNRVRDRAKRDVIDLHCCHCQAITTQTGYGARNAPVPSMVACGEFVTL